MISIGKSARRLRESHGLTQRLAAERLGVSNVHLCNIENDKSAPSATLLEAYREVFGVDLYVMAWCEYGDIKALPKSVQKAARQLRDAWRSELLDN